ncbi:MAG: hypothetical protein IPN76_20255 [Saprospiraceae bacterium]|nr:hypothetical protein [Saprospiraceae bacterium]
MKYLRAYKDMEPTYAELASALQMLKFVNESTTDNFRYAHKKSGAIVLLKMLPDDAKVHKARFAALSWNLEQFGVLKQEDDLGKLIEKMRLAEQQPAS